MFAIVILYTEPEEDAYPVPQGVIAPFASEAEATAYAETKRAEFESYEVVPLSEPEISDDQKTPNVPLVGGPPPPKNATGTGGISAGSFAHQQI
jgi:hypothetical protein